MKYILILIMIMLMFLNNKCSEPYIIPEDSSMLAIAADDVTAFIKGCGSQPMVGYVYCRKTTGDSTKDFLTFYTPNLNCTKPFCAEVKLYHPNGDVIGYNIPNDPGFIMVRWSDITGKDTFDKSDRGFYGVMYKYEYLDNYGLLSTVFTNGEIRLRVIASNYIPIHNVINDSNIAITRKFGKYIFGLTTSGRSSIWEE